MCPHCGKGIILELEVGIAHASGRVRKPEEKRPLKVKAVPAE